MKNMFAPDYFKNIILRLNTIITIDYDCFRSISGALRIPRTDILKKPTTLSKTMIEFTAQPLKSRKTDIFCKNHLSHARDLSDFLLYVEFLIPYELFSKKN